MANEIETADETVTSTVVVDAPADEVWELLIDDDELSTWLGDRVTLDPVPGGHGTVTDDGGVERVIRVDEVAPGESITWRWWPADEGGDTTSVRIDLLPEGDGTEIRVTETVCAAAVGPTADAWSGRLLSAELTMICRSTVLAAVRA
jgi:uncharacterized protein YndB with AHSA1/START domain